jgi:hypothetical protein
MVEESIPPQNDYRVYMIGANGGFQRSLDLKCENDQQALEQAKEYAQGCVVELWKASERIAVIPLNRGNDPIND